MLLAAAEIFLIAVCRRKPFPLLPLQMTEETIGDPSTPSGHPSGPRHGHTRRGHDQTSWPPPRSPAGSGPADQACSFAASGQNLPSPQTASQEEDRKMTGSFTGPPARVSVLKIALPTRSVPLMRNWRTDRVRPCPPGPAGPAEPE